MNRTCKSFLAALVISFAPALAAAQTQTAAPVTPAQPALYKADKGPYKVTTKDEDWHDDARKRTVPVRVFIPATPAGKELAKLPVIVFSHGWGASRTSYGYFCEHMASQGYLVVAPTHPGSDTASIPRGGAAGDRSDRLRERLLGKSGENGGDKKEADGNKADEQPKQEGLMESIADPENLRNRPRDISFVIDQLDKRAATKDLADLSRIGVAGHSFGAYTAMAIGGMTVQMPNDKAESFRDPRVKAVLPMSPEGRGTMGIEPGAWDHFAAPVLFLTGTKDYGAGNRPASWRRQPFDAVTSVDDYLVTIEGARHLTFGRPETEAPLIQSVSTAFFDAYVCNNPAARAWLESFANTKHKDCSVESKTAPVAPGHK